MEFIYDYWLVLLRVNLCNRKKVPSTGKKAEWKWTLSRANKNKYRQSRKEFNYCSPWMKSSRNGWPLTLLGFFTLQCEIKYEEGYPDMRLIFFLYIYVVIVCPFSFCYTFFAFGHLDYYDCYRKQMADVVFWLDMRGPNAGSNKSLWFSNSSFSSVFSHLPTVFPVKILWDLSKQLLIRSSRPGI